MLHSYSHNLHSLRVVVGEAKAVLVMDLENERRILIENGNEMKWDGLRDFDLVKGYC
jgi:hypothetical protein